MGGGWGGLLVRLGLEGHTEHSVPFPTDELDGCPSGIFACPLLPPRVMVMGEMTRWQAPGIQMRMAV